MTGEIRNPANLPTDLYPAEEKFARCLAAGIPCRVGNGELPKKGIESGEGANLVRSEVIRFFAYGGDGDYPVLGSVINLEGAWISGESLVLAHANIPVALDFILCHFDIIVNMQHAECISLYMHGCHLAKGLKGDGLKTKGGVFLRSLRKNNSGRFSAKGEVRLIGASIGGYLDCLGGSFDNSDNPNEYALVADRIKVKDSVYLRGEFKGEVRFLGADIEEIWIARGGVLTILTIRRDLHFPLIG